MAISSAYRHHGDLHNACPEIVFLDRVYSQTHVDHDRPNKKNKKQKKKTGGVIFRFLTHVQIGKETESNCTIVISTSWHYETATQWSGTHNPQAAHPNTIFPEDFVEQPRVHRGRHRTRCWYIRGQWF